MLVWKPKILPGKFEKQQHLMYYTNKIDQLPKTTKYFQIWKTHTVQKTWLKISIL